MTKVCDFCLAPGIDWRYPANDFVLEAYGWRSVGDWASCHTCSELIEAGELDTLAERSQSSQGSPRTRGVVLNVLRTAHAAFMVNRTGPRRPL